jgi:uncharacterized protein YaiL (DUF2058 family)
MAGSLQDQLLNIGLVDKKKAKQAQQEKKKSAKQANKARKSGAKEAVQDPQQQLEQARLEKQQRDKALNLQREAERAQKAREAEARQMIEQHRIHIPQDADVPYNFVENKKIKRIYVTAALQAQLSRAQLAIALLDDKHYLVPDDTAAKIAERMPDWITRIQKEEKPAEDDPYADYQIPDDLMW